MIFTNVIALLYLVHCSLSEEVRLLNLDPPEAQQYIDKQDTTLKYAPKIETNVPAVRFLGNEPHNVVEDIYLANQYHGQDGLGGYLYGYSVPDIAKTEKKVAGGDLTGAYNYIAGDGQEIKVQYWDDGTGFHQIDNVPKILPKQIDDTPEVKAAKEEHQRIWNEQAERNSRPIENPFDRHFNYAQGQGPTQAQQLVNQYQQQKNQFPNPGQNVHYQGDQYPQFQSQPSQNVNKYQQPAQYAGVGSQSGGLQAGGQLGGGQSGSGQYGGTQLGGGQIGGSTPASGQYGGAQSGIGQIGGSTPASGQYGGAQLGTGQVGGSTPASGQYGGVHLGSGQIGGSTPATGQYGGQLAGSQSGAGQYSGSQSSGGQLGGGIVSVGVQPSGSGQYGGSQAVTGQYGAGSSLGGPFGGSQGSASGQVSVSKPAGSGQYGSSGQTVSGQYGAGPSSLGGPFGGGQGSASGQVSVSKPVGSGQYGSSGQSGSGQYGGGGQIASGQYGGGSSGGQVATGYSGGQYGASGQYGGGQSSGSSSQYSSQYSGGQESSGQYDGRDEGKWNDAEEEKGPPKGFFYNFDYPVGIIVQKDGGAVKREGDLKDIYSTNKASFEKQVQQGSGSSSGYLIQ